MPQFCTCGAELPPDARFCHKCGKPQREELILQEEESAPPEPLPVQPAETGPPPIGFHNALAVRLGFFTAMIANLLILLPYLYFGCPLWLVTAGFLCVYWYSRRTGQHLSVRSGARMGWITGLFSFVIFTVMFTFSFVQAVRSGAFANLTREQLSHVPLIQGNVDQVLELLRSPVGLALNLLFSLIVLFVVFTMFPVVGGALGAKVLSRD